METSRIAEFPDEIGRGLRSNARDRLEQFADQVSTKTSTDLTLQFPQTAAQDSDILACPISSWCVPE
jgi:type IV pilus biogenesis protein CpaD/CtpE